MKILNILHKVAKIGGYVIVFFQLVDYAIVKIQPYVDNTENTHFDDLTPKENE